MRFEKLEQMLRNDGVGGVQVTMNRHGINGWKAALVGEYLPPAHQRHAVGRTLIDALWNLEEEAGGVKRTAQECEDEESLLLRVIHAANAEGLVHYVPRSSTFVGTCSIAGISSSARRKISEERRSDCRRGTLLEAVMGAASELIRSVDALHRREHLR